MDVRRVGRRPAAGGVGRLPAVVNGEAITQAGLTPVQLPKA
jgi:hypothetical protein